MSSCVTMHVPEGKSLYKKTKVKKAPSEFESKLESLSLQNPNRKALFVFPVYLKIHYVLSSGKQTKIKKKLNKVLGEKPVYFDSIKMKESARQMKSFLINKGYFNAQIESSYRYKRKKKVIVTYTVQPGNRKEVGEINYRIKDSILRDFILRKSFEHLYSGDPFDSDNLVKERERIEHELRENGYYSFSKSYIYFDVDTSGKSGKVNIGLSINNPENSNSHHKYSLQDISIEQDYSLFDTTRKDSIEIDDITFIQDEEVIKNEILTNAIQFSTGDLYSEEEVEKSIASISDLQVFKFIDVDFEQIGDTLPNETLPLHCRIRLSPQPKQELSLQLELNTTEADEFYATETNESYRYFGISPSVGYSNLNIFKRALQWNVRLRTSYEISNDWLSSGEGQNLLEIGLNTSFIQPNARFPEKVFKKPLSKLTRTNTNFAYYYNITRDFTRSTISSSYSYLFINDINRHIFTPFELNRVSTVELSDEFRDELAEQDNPLLASIFSTYLVSGMRYSYIYNDQPIQGANHWAIRWNVIETSGNLFYGAFSMFSNQETREDEAFQYKFGDLGFYQYIKTEIDVRKYLSVFNTGQLVFRLDAGLGVPYGNSREIPFERRFFVGGSNSIRAWTVRELGPGSSRDTLGNIGLRIYQVGDIKLVGNIEYRFDMLYFIDGALFIDAGNIWEIPASWKQPGVPINEDAEFKSTFYREIAIGSGIGFRLDFEFFVFRFDFAWRLRDPLLLHEENENNAWTFNNFNWTPRLNIGVGYPF